MSDKTTINATFERPDIEQRDGKTMPAASESRLVLPPPEAYDPKRVNWRLITWGLLGTLGVIILVTYSQSIFLPLLKAQVVQEQPRFIPLLSPTPSPTPLATPTARERGIEVEKAFTFAEPTATPTPVPGGRVLALFPESRDVGWVVSHDETIVTEFDPQNHLGDSFLYAGILDGHIYHGILQFDLSRIPRGTQIHAASLRLTGLRVDQLRQMDEWRLQLLPQEIDERWRDHNFTQIHNSPIESTFTLTLTSEQLDVGQVNQFEFTPEQLALLERRILEGSDQFGRQVSFRLDGPTAGDDNLFAWDSGFGPASKGKNARPELFLSLGPPPQETPPPFFVIITSTPTPESIMTAVANSVQMTAEAGHYGTATPLPRHWVTPVVVTATPTAENEATVQAMDIWATAIALTTGEPPNLATATPTPTYVIITSTPTPENIMTAAAEVQQVTAEAIQFGTATPFPPNWVTPAVVVDTPTPQNSATVAYWQAVALTTGTPTSTPANVQTATSTPDFVTVEPFASPTATATPSATPQPVPKSLLGKIVFLSDREGPTEEERIRAERLNVTPQITPQPFVIDPETGQLSRLTNIWPYEVAATREAWSADTNYETYTQQLLWSNKLAIHYYDYLYNVEHSVTEMGAGITYDPAWSPVSDEIAFVATESGNDEVWVINRDGTNPRQLTRNQWEWDKHPSWSPDGQQIVFYSNRTGTNQLWIMNKDGGEQRLLMDLTPYNNWDPVWIKYLEPAPFRIRQPDWRFIKPAEESQQNR